jgi:branched-chain amino acid transport system substrate-binding protein
LSAAVVALLVLTACGMAAGQRRPGTDLRGPVRIALVDLFSGPSGYTGEYVQNSLQVEVDALNARGGLLGSRLEVVAADDERKADKGAELVREQLLEGDVKLLVGPSSTSAALAARPFVNSSRIANCALDLSDEAAGGAPFTFRIQEQDRYRVPALLGYVLRSRPEIKRIGLAGAGDAAAQLYERELQDQAGRFGLQYVGSVTAAGVSDHRGLVQQLVQKGAQAVVLSSDPATAGRTAQAIGQLGLGKQLQMLGPSELGTYSFAQQVGDPASGLVFESTIMSYLTGIPDSKWPPLYQSFVSRVSGQYGYASNGVEIKGLPAAADCVLEWSQAVRKAGTFEGVAVARAWESLDLSPEATVLGAREKLAPSDHNAVPQEGIFVYQWVKNGDHWALKQLMAPTP